jgi:putative tryptophan/tyrosine transport system substrate-binding protein
MSLSAPATRCGADVGRISFALALVIGSALMPEPGRAQAAKGVPRVGILSYFAAPSAAAPDPAEAGLRQGLRELGYVEGQNILIERRYAAGRPERLTAMAQELVRMKVDVILAGGQPSREAAREATRTIPIVTLSGSDPVREGWAQSLARPGGNVTGLTFTFPEIGAKRLELLKEASPRLTRVALLVDPIELVDVKDVIRETEAAAQRLGLQLQLLEVHGSGDLEPAFELARRGGAQALLAFAMWPYRQRVASLATNDGLLTIGESSQEVQAGFLLGYGADLDDLIRRSVLQMGKILKGAPPGELPVQRPTKFTLSVNLKTAQALGITMPPALLLHADEVID